MLKITSVGVFSNKKHITHPYDFENKAHEVDYKLLGSENMYRNKLPSGNSILLIRDKISPYILRFVLKINEI